MNKVNVGMYVRTKTGYILKIVNINEYREPSLKYGVTASYLKDVAFIGDDDIKGEPSFDITDLIEVDDYVNGSKVQEIREGYVEIEEYSGLNNDLPCKVEAKDIKSVLTKEQFEIMEYKVGDDNE